MDTSSFSSRTCLVYSLVLLIACSRIASSQNIPQEKPVSGSVALDMASVLNIILNRAPVIDRAQTQAPTTTTTSTTTKADQEKNYLNDDGSVNRNRAGLLTYYTSTPKAADRNAPALTYLDILLRRFPFVQQTPKSAINGYRSYDQTTAPPAPSAAPTSHETPATTKKNGALIVTNGGVFIVNNGSGKTPSTKEEKIEIQDKPYTSVPDDFFENKNRK